ncbi:MAG: hypothetical protein KR126chlam3_00735 [Chlamydiae bacterium]|nr:hypothetical protein [Chlamydiota bacterium]
MPLLRSSFQGFKQHDSLLGDNLVEDTKKSISKWVSDLHTINPVMEYFNELDENSRDRFSRHERSPSQVYSVVTSDWVNSINLHLWELISEYRAKHEGNTVHKIAASAAYFMNFIFGIVETSVRGAGALVVGNPISRVIAALVRWDGELLDYNPVVFMTNASIDYCSQGVFQNLVSSLTNLDSHSTNMLTAERVKRATRNKFDFLSNLVELKIFELLLKGVRAMHKV